MDIVQIEIILGVLCLGALICIVAIAMKEMHRHTHSKIDDVHDSVRGVRVRLERHADESTDERKNIHSDNKRFHARIYSLVVEWLQLMRGK